MEEILNILENGDLENIESHFYSKFGKLNCGKSDNAYYLCEKFLPRLYELYDKEILRKDVVYLVLLSYYNLELLQTCLKYDKTIFKLNIQSPSSLYDYCIYKKHHWIENVVTNSEIYQSLFNHDVYNKILILKCLLLLNSSEIDVDILKGFNVKQSNAFWQHFIEQTQHFLDIVNYCQVSSDSNYNEIFFYIVNHSSLETLSNYLDLKMTNPKDISELLSKDIYKNGMNLNHFVLFNILSVIFKCILSELDGKKFNYAITEVKQDILGIEDKRRQIELLQNIFATIFIKREHLHNSNSTKEYICQQREIRIILFLLKEITSELKLKQDFNKQSPDYIKLIELNKLVTDALWRMELIINVKDEKKCMRNILKYMLAPAESLIQMCFKCQDFERVYQVLQLFPLSEECLQSEVAYSEKLYNLRDTLKKKFKVKAIQLINPNLSTANIDTAIEKTIEQFFKTNPIIVNPKIEEIISQLTKNNTFFSHYKAENEIFMNMLDLAITQPNNFEECASLLQLAFENNTLDSNVNSAYSKFCKKILELCSNNNISATEALMSPQYYIDGNKYKTEQEFYRSLVDLFDEMSQFLYINENGTLNLNHPSHRSLMKLNNLCNEYYSSSTGVTDNIKYLSKLFNYLKAFSRIFYIEQNTSDIIARGKNASYIDLLYQNRSELMGKLLFEIKLDPSEFEKYFGKLKLDYLYHIAGNCFPTINLHSQEHLTKDELYPENSLYVPNKSIMIYIQKRNWLLAFFLKEMHKIQDVKMDISEIRVQTFLNYLQLDKIKCLKVIYEDNYIITALQNEISTQKVSNYIHSQILKHESMISSQQSITSYESLETGEELAEDTLKTTNWKALYDIIESVPENQIKKCATFDDLKDLILVNLIQDRFEIHYYKYVQFINNRDLKIDTIMEHFKEWPGRICMDLIKWEISAFDAIHDRRLIDLKKWLVKIQLYEELMGHLECNSWASAHDLCTNQPEFVVENLLKLSKVRPILNFIILHKVPDDLLQKIDEYYFLKAFEASDFSSIKQLLDNLPYQHTLKVCHNLLKILKNLDYLQFTINYLLHNVQDNITLKNVSLSLKILSVFTQTKQEQLLCLIYEPLSIIEVLVMNTKLEKLSIVLDILRTEISYIQDNKLCLESIDEIIRNYAEKSLDFGIIAQPNPRLLRTPEHKLMQSLDSVNLSSETRGFIMPDEVPNRTDWVTNEDVLECMRCQKVTFSMFNRRHHCRRCGRVICYNCSQQRISVPTYEDIVVRVCDDCYRQTLGLSDTSEICDTVSTKSTVHDYWLLTDNAEHNKIIRGEFSYEHAPSVSLCLSLLKYHSKSAECARFLLDQCNAILKLLLPSQEPVQEIDYFLVIKMLKALAFAAKMSSTECNLPYGSSVADRIISQIELLNLLVERGCLTLLPVSNAHNQGPYIDAPILRRLRDKLMEREQWNLALEVSIKAGLDNTGIFAAWGKSCLKAGCLHLAREKFQRCFDKTGFCDSTIESSFSEDTDTLDRSKSTSRASLLSSLSENKPAKNPALLDEILHILETNSQPIDNEVIEKTEKRKIVNVNQNFGGFVQAESAICILSKLNNLKNVAVGKYNHTQDKETRCAYKSSVDKIFFNECVYYLIKYGSHLSLLEFYIRHGHFQEALNYILDAQLSSDIFIEIYMKCLRDGIVNTLQENMSIIDSSLEVWKDILRTLCWYLEKRNMLHSLYQLQQYMGDYIRAAMTCIRFYEQNVANFTDLVNNVRFLNKAEEHLKQVIEQEQWIEVAAVPKLSSASKESFEEKGIVNYSLVMKMNQDDIYRHIDTILLQKHIAKFLAECELFDIKPTDILADIKPVHDLESHEKPKERKSNLARLPSLFGTTLDKTGLAILTIISGKTVQDGFVFALRIIEKFKLKPVKVYCEAGKQLAKAERYNSIAELVNCIKQSSTNDSDVTDMCDQMLTWAIVTFTRANVSGTRVEDLIKLISDKAVKISAYIEAKQLKTAYFLAVKYKRMSDIRRILREAELLNQPSIKALCQKVLQSYSHSPLQSKE